MKKKTVTIVNDHQLLSDLLAYPIQGMGFGPPHMFTYKFAGRSRLPAKPRGFVNIIDIFLSKIVKHETNKGKVRC